MQSAVNNFNEFIGRHHVYNKNEHYTHTNLSNNSYYCFDGADYQQFIKLYSKVMKTDYDLHFVEHPNRNGITYLFIDINYDHKNENRLYKGKHIRQIIKSANKFLSDNFDVTKNQLTAFVTEKSKPCKYIKKNNIYKDGFHIYYPFLPLDEKHRLFVISSLSKIVNNHELFEDIKYENSADTIFNTSIVKDNGIMMLGSKNVDEEPYKLTAIYNSNVNEIDYKTYISDHEELLHILSNCQYDRESAVNSIDDIDIEETIETKTKVRKINKDDYVKKTETKINIQKQKEINLTKALCKILSKNRSEEYTSWSHVGFVLKAIHESLYNDFVEFSKKSSKYNDGKISCRDIWNSTDNNSDYYTIGTLRHWAQKDNPKEYYKIIRTHNPDIFNKIESGKHVDIAYIVHALYKDRFVCTDIPKKKWYEFQNHRWILVQSAYTLENLISGDVRKMLNAYVSERYKAISNFDDDDIDDDDYKAKDTTEAEQKKLSKITKIIENLGDVGFRESVVKACANIFYDGEFQSKLDTNVYLVGFLNGVYDLKNKCFRDGLPSDYTCKTVGYNWKHLTGNEPTFKKIDKYFSEVFVKEDMRDYILTFIAKILRGIPDTKLHIWNGGGSNAKSTTVDLIKFTFGDYFGVVPVTIITRKRGGSSNATPELADKFGKRCIIIQEPEHNDVVYVGQMKEYTGGDTLMARPLYGDPFYYVPQFTMILTCNNLPHIPANDNGTWRRLRVTPFESEFIEPDDAKKNGGCGEKQFIKDDELKESLPHWGPYLMWLIITKYYPIYEKGYGGKPFKILEPEIVKQYTNDYKNNSDVYAEFLDTNVDITKENDDNEKIDFLYDSFKGWYTGSYSDKAPDKKTFTNYFTKNKFKMDKRCIYGVKARINFD